MYGDAHLRRAITRAVCRASSMMAPDAACNMEERGRRNRRANLAFKHQWQRNKAFLVGVSQHDEDVAIVHTPSTMLHLHCVAPVSSCSIDCDTSYHDCALRMWRQEESTFSFLDSICDTSTYILPLWILTTICRVCEPDFVRDSPSCTTPRHTSVAITPDMRRNGDGKMLRNRLSVDLVRSMSNIFDNTIFLFVPITRLGSTLRNYRIWPAWNVVGRVILIFTMCLEATFG